MRTYQSIDEAFRSLVREFQTIQTVAESEYRETSRAGAVLRYPLPVLIEYSEPTKRVLLNRARDINPFFLLFESLWMLAGRDDLRTISYFNSNLAKVAGDGGDFLNGAYGARWRSMEAVSEDFDGPVRVDQLGLIIDHLRKVPNSRRAVLQMWNVPQDLLKIETSNDVCCNTHVYFSIRTVPLSTEQDPRDWDKRPSVPYLDMTVCNRSNDLVWGLLGSDYVNLTFLQEYVAAGIGIAVGRYFHMTNNLHVYPELNWKPTEWLEANDVDEDTMRGVAGYSYQPTSLVQDRTRFDMELLDLMLWREYVLVQTEETTYYEPVFQEPFLRDVAIPMFRAFDIWKARRQDPHWWAGCRVSLDQVKDPCWAKAGTHWIAKRTK